MQAQPPQPLSVGTWPLLHVAEQSLAPQCTWVLVQVSPPWQSMVHVPLVGQLTVAVSHLCCVAVQVTEQAYCAGQLMVAPKHAWSALQLTRQS